MDDFSYKFFVKIPKLFCIKMVIWLVVLLLLGSITSGTTEITFHHHYSLLSIEKFSVLLVVLGLDIASKAIETTYSTLPKAHHCKLSFDIFDLKYYLVSGVVTKKDYRYYFFLYLFITTTKEYSLLPPAEHVQSLLLVMCIITNRMLGTNYSRILITSSLDKVLVPLKSSLWLGTVLFPIYMYKLLLIKSSPSQAKSW